MATVLEKPLVRETGLTRDGREFSVILLPSDSGGTIAFKEKGKRGQGIEVSLAEVLELAQGGAPKPKPKPVVKEFDGDVSDLDLVDLATLETRIMIDAQELMEPAIKGRLWAIIRQMREERREEAGAPPVVGGRRREREE